MEIRIIIDHFYDLRIQILIKLKTFQLESVFKSFDVPTEKNCKSNYLSKEPVLPVIEYIKRTT